MKTALFLLMLTLTNVTERAEILTHEKFREVYDNSVMAEEEFSQENYSDISVFVVLATWCSDSVDHVPVFFRIEDQVKFEFVEYFNAEKGFKEDKGIIEDFQIERVPTFIFMKNGEEIGRIVETPEKSMVEDVKAICSAKK